MRIDRSGVPVRRSDRRCAIADGKSGTGTGQRDARVRDTPVPRTSGVSAPEVLGRDRVEELAELLDLVLLLVRDDQPGLLEHGVLGVPIHAEESVLAEAGLIIPDEQEDEVEKFREFLDSISPEDFRGAQP